jgi:hypothetical protein
MFHCLPGGVTIEVLEILQFFYDMGNRLTCTERGKSGFTTCHGSKGTLDASTILFSFDRYAVAQI